ncbi:24921_t:CDS:2 [Dentiscutata erythropus]|uniref:24921_t:CDS:1 n=1 Tax=Dentiscutata erythropus TaxID=1348616 RepID=A0A9N9N274_9GLOM|nr:24921_t:CDS:2 [Dentiscutata erythropus]
MYSEQNYPGYEALITYLTRSRNKSFLGFLRRCRDVIVATTSATSRWVDLDHTWAVRFISEAGKLGDDLEEKVSPSPLFRRPNFVVGKGLRIPEEESVMCLPFGACRLSSDFSIL